MKRFVLPVLTLALLAVFTLVRDSEAKHYEPVPPISVACYVDTSAFDTFSTGVCGALGTSPSTATFKLQGLEQSGRNFAISWSVGSCTGQYCSVAISPRQTITATATVVEVGHGNSDSASATAYYFYEPGF